MKIVSNVFPRVRSVVDCSDEAIIEREQKGSAAAWELPSGVDQAGARAADINVIVATFGKQGLRPSDIPGRVGEFLDNTQIPDFLSAFEIIENAKQLFEQLPVSVRRAMDHDPSRLEEFLRDKNNEEMLYKEGVFERKPIIDPETAPLDKKTFKEVMKGEKKPKEPAN